MHLKTSSADFRPFCPYLNMLNHSGVKLYITYQASVYYMYNKTIKLF